MVPKTLLEREKVIDDLLETVDHWKGYPVSVSEAYDTVFQMLGYGPDQTEERAKVKPRVDKFFNQHGFIVCGEMFGYHSGRDTTLRY